MPPAAGPAPDEARIDFSEILDALRQGKWIILLTSIVVVAAMAAYTSMIPPTYQASSVVYINAGPALPAGFLAGTEQRAVANELGILQQSVELAARVAARIQETAAVVGSPERFPILHSEAGDTLSARQVATRLLQQVSFRSHMTQDMIGITAESTTPEEAALIADMYAEEYVKFSREASRESIAAKKAFLQDQVEKRRSELDEIEDRWETFAQQKQVVALGSEGQRLVSEFAALKGQRDNAAFQLEQEKHSLQLLKQELERVQPGLADRLTSTRSTSQIESRINALDNQIAGLEVQAGQYYAVNANLRGNEQSIPELADITKRIQYFKEQREDLTRQLVSQTSELTTTAEGSGQMEYVVQLKNKILEKNMTIRELQHQIAGLDVRLGAYGGDLQSIPRQAIESKQLERQRAIAEQWYTTFIQELQRTMIAEEAELGYAKVIRSAIVPALPVRPNVKQNLILGMLLGLGLGIGLAFAKRAMNSRLQQPEELEEKGYNLIGVIPPMDKAIKATFDGKDEIEVEGKKLSTRLITLLDPWSPIAENYRLVRTNVEFSRAGAPVQVMLVTSPEMSDGKTVTALNLAIAMAQGGRRTLLIDADLRRPAAHKLLGLSSSTGLADVLDGKEVEPHQSIIKDLSFMAAGKATLPPAEVLGSEAMLAFLERMRAQYDVVIVDSPPVLAVTDAVLLAPMCDATLVVVSANQTDLQALEVTRKTLASVGVSIAGTIFNRFDVQKAKGRGYGYGYGYGDYVYGQEQTAA